MQTNTGSTTVVRLNSISIYKRKQTEYTGDGVDSGHETLNNAEPIVDNLGQWSKAVGGATGVGNNVQLGFVFLLVHTHNKHWGIFARGGDHNLLGTTLIPQNSTSTTQSITYNKHIKRSNHEINQS